MASLVVLTGALQGRTFPLEKSLTIGREEGHPIAMPANKGCSRQHAKIWRTGMTTFEIVDLASRNGTFVNDERVERRALQPGDKIRIGDSLLRFDA